MGSFKDVEMEREYALETTRKTLKLGKITSLLAVVALPVFALQDIFVLKMQVLQWRMIGLAPFILFAALAFTFFDSGRKFIVASYSICLSCVMVMMAGITLSVFTAPAVSEYDSYLVLDSLTVCMVILFVLSGGARKYFPAIVAVPIILLLAYLGAAGALSPAGLAKFSNPVAVCLVLIIMANVQEKLAFSEFAMRMLAERRGKVIEEKSAELSASLKQLELDFEEKKRTAEQIRQDQQILQAFLDAVTEPAFIMDRQASVVFANQAFASRTRRRLDEVIGTEISILLPREAEKYEASIKDALIPSGKPVKMEIEENGRIIENTVYPVLDSDDEVIYLGVLGKDITERRTNERELEFFAVHDMLTGLYNRRFLLERIQKTIAQSRRGHLSSLLYIDLDNFKIINDMRGHEAGDAVLKRIAEFLTASIRNEDSAFRIGGDEFAVILNGMGGKSAAAVAERLRAALHRQEFVFDEDVFSVGLSIGVVEIDGLKDGDLLLAQADKAMYEAKKRGKNKVEEYPGAESGEA